MWTKGTVTKQWGDEYKNYKYTCQPAKQCEIERWNSLGYTHNKFTGEMYNSTNPMPLWTELIAKKIGLFNCGFVFYRMKTGVIMPTHVDHFDTYCQVFSVDRTAVTRAIVFLEDWQSGHYFEIDNTAITDYRAGDYVRWSCDVPHFAANIGVSPRYTLQITGVLDV